MISMEKQANDPKDPDDKYQDLKEGVKIAKVIRKPAKMGIDYVIWIPRIYIRNGLIDPEAEYVAFFKKSESEFLEITKNLSRMGTDYVFWIPRRYIQSQTIDTTKTYEIYFKKVVKKDESV